MLNEKIHAGEFILSEGNGSISREQITVASGEDLPAGQVVGQITATSLYVAYNDGATDGSEVAAGILFDAVDATAASTPGVIVSRLAEVSESLLTGLDANGRADLLARNIIIR